MFLKLHFCDGLGTSCKIMVWGFHHMQSVFGNATAFIYEQQWLLFSETVRQNRRLGCIEFNNTSYRGCHHFIKRRTTIPYLNITEYLVFHIGPLHSSKSVYDLVKNWNANQMQCTADSRRKYWDACCCTHRNWHPIRHPYWQLVKSHKVTVLVFQPALVWYFVSGYYTLWAEIAWVHGGRAHVVGCELIFNKLVTSLQRSVITHVPWEHHIKNHDWERYKGSVMS